MGSGLVVYQMMTNSSDDKTATPPGKKNIFAAKAKIATESTVNKATAAKKT